MGKILIIDDDTYVCSQLETLLNKNGFETVAAYSANYGLKALKKGGVDLVLCDYRLPDADGMEVFTRIKKIHPLMPVVFMTAYADVRTAVRMIRAGAFDYVTKPFLPEEILGLTRRILSYEGERFELFDKHFVKGKCSAIRNIMAHIDLVAPTSLSVLIEGETGSGKEFIARAIHFKSPRKEKPFVALDCGALPGELANSELFGHVKGAFTGAIKDKTGCFVAAEGGTLFLDEIGNLRHENQIRLLRTLQEKTVTPLGDNKSIKVDVRIIAAANEDLKTTVREGKFREDLYHRINGFSINLPSLRERKEDIFEFASHFLNKANSEFGKDIKGFDNDVRQVFLEYAWPGNIRELENVVKRCVLLAKGDKVTTETLPDEIRYCREEMPPQKGAGYGGKRQMTLKHAAMTAERDAIVAALKSSGYNKTRAARILEVDRKTLYNKMREYSIAIH